MGVIVKRLDEGDLSIRQGGLTESLQVKFLCLGATSRLEAIQEVLKSAPPFYLGMYMGSVRFSDWEDGGGSCVISVEYETLEQHTSTKYTKDEEEDEDKDYAPVMSFDSGSGTAHIVRAFAQEKHNGKTGDDSAWGPDDAAGMIGWNGKVGDDCEFAGVDVPCADMRITYTKRMSVSKATSTRFMRACAECSGKVNGDKFMGWKRCELLFLNASFQASLKGEKWTDVSFNFRVNPTKENFILDGKELGKKMGWEYVWTRTDDKMVGDKVERGVVGVYKSTVFEEADFKMLGI